MPKVTLPGSELVRVGWDAEVRNVVFRDVENDQAGRLRDGSGETPELRAALVASPFAALGYRPDRWKADLEFELCHSLPAILGPVAQGFYVGYLPQTLQASHESLIHQQVNLNHLLKAYSTSGDEVARDRIVGCVVATWFPKEPFNGWKTQEWSKGVETSAAPAIRACAAIFKLAEGVNRVVGDHQASRKTQSISIEAITQLGNIGIYLPSRGIEAIVPIMACEEEAILDVLETSPLSIGKVNGEQAIFIYGLNGRAIDLRGVGITPRPAEAEAKIISFAAAQSHEVEGGTLMALAASKVDEELTGRTVKFPSGRSGKIEKVWTEGKARLPQNSWGIAASTEEPILEVMLAQSATRRPEKILRRLSEVRDRVQSA